MSDWSDPYSRVRPALMQAEEALAQHNWRAGHKALTAAIAALVETRAALGCELKAIGGGKFAAVEAGVYAIPDDCEIVTLHPDGPRVA